MEKITVRKILVLEDSREDRLRFRHLFKQAGLADNEFEFAWAWPKNKAPSVQSWIDNKVKGSRANWQSHYSLLLLDLAWTNKAENLMRRLLCLPPGSAEKLAPDKNSTINVAGQVITRQQLFQDVEGINLLKSLPENGSPQVYVTSAYVAATATEIRHILETIRPEVQMYHKWIDELPLRQKIKEHSRPARQK